MHLHIWKACGFFSEGEEVDVISEVIELFIGDQSTKQIIIPRTDVLQMFFQS